QLASAGRRAKRPVMGIEAFQAILRDDKLRLVPVDEGGAPCEAAFRWALDAGSLAAIDIKMIINECGEAIAADIDKEASKAFTGMDITSALLRYGGVYPNAQATRKAVRQLDQQPPAAKRIPDLAQACRLFLGFMDPWEKRPEDR